eukprot:CAMPEP_0175075936 /NCGR_PEP_ID=MMETSP0052_2-20121109/22380_1 /TAXON_ID=51329 ORGANISM="Polytomella parva, Strain SAG 63-3" /NCGR_SAMPLE_ID=MMETSP0052_2 /ASSEMBLY_ACC=CAM_ASM_000194 /LENGTH=271 /DNA_ID=CAMNT_0016344883 /DNA_START=29 /DNA_END=840 /DNA_ORIENTATION=-
MEKRKGEKGSDAFGKRNLNLKELSPKMGNTWTGSESSSSDDEEEPVPLFSSHNWSEKNSSFSVTSTVFEKSAVNASNRTFSPKPDALLSAVPFASNISKGSLNMESLKLYPTTNNNINEDDEVSDSSGSMDESFAAWEAKTKLGTNDRSSFALSNTINSQENGVGYRNSADIDNSDVSYSNACTWEALEATAAIQRRTFNAPLPSVSISEDEDSDDDPNDGREEGEDQTLEGEDQTLEGEGQTLEGKGKDTERDGGASSKCEIRGKEGGRG